MSSYLKLAIVFSKLAQKHGTKILHSTDVDLLTKDLGHAIKRQKATMLDPDMGIVETTYEVLPLLAEVQILTFAVSKKMGIDKDTAIETLEEIVKQTEAKGSDAADDIKEALDWTRKFMAIPEVKKMLETDLIQIEKPKDWKNWRGLGAGALQGTQRIIQEANRLQTVIEKAKEEQRKKDEAEKAAKRKINEPKGKGPKKP